MFKQLLVGGLLVGALLAAACKDKEEEPPSVAGGTVLSTTASPAATPEPQVAYTQGFYDLEQNGTTTWRWMSDRGVVRLKNTGKDMKLKLVGHFPSVELRGEQKLSITFNGEKLEEIVGKGDMQKEIVVPATKQGSAPGSELVLTASKSFVPKEIDKKSNDTRKLAFSVSQLMWQEK
jgi:hypothetical protein